MANYPIPEPYRSPDLALVPAQTAPRAEYYYYDYYSTTTTTTTTNNNNNNNNNNITPALSLILLLVSIFLEFVVSIVLYLCVCVMY